MVLGLLLQPTKSTLLPGISNLRQVIIKYKIIFFFLGFDLVLFFLHFPRLLGSFFLQLILGNLNLPMLWEKHL